VFGATSIIPDRIMDLAEKPRDAEPATNAKPGLVRLFASTTQADQISSGNGVGSTMGTIRNHHRNTTLTRYAGAMRRKGMEEEEIFAAISKANENRCDPPPDEVGVRGIAKSLTRYKGPRTWQAASQSQSPNVETSNEASLFARVLSPLGFLFVRLLCHS
jgi:hypothetical protein